MSWMLGFFHFSPQKNIIYWEYPKRGNTIMLDKKVFASAGGNYNPIPMGAYQCLIADVEMVTAFNSFKNIEEDKLKYTLLVLDDVKCEDGTSTRGRKLQKRCTNSVHEKAELTKLVKAALGRNLTKAEADAFDVESIVGKQVKVLVEQAPSKDGTTIWNNITSFSAAMAPMEPVAYTPKPNVVQTSSHPVEVEEEADPDKMIEKLEEEAKAK